MSRPWRIEYEGALYHLLSRGNEGSDIFIDEKDRNRFLETVGEMSERFVHAKRLSGAAKEIRDMPLYGISGEPVN